MIFDNWRTLHQFKNAPESLRQSHRYRLLISPSVIISRRFGGWVWTRVKTH